MIFGTLFVWAAGLMTSPSLLSLSHILMAFPGFYFLKEQDYKKVSKSTWALIAMTVIIILSVLFNQDIAVQGYKPILKSKYFIFGFLSITPIAWWIKNYLTEKNLTYLLYIFCISTTVATISGIIGMQTGVNIVSFKIVALDRNAGLFGMLMNYAHNMTFFLIILVGIIINQKELKKIININWMYFFFFINLAGLYLTYTRGALLALVIGIPFFYLNKNKKIFLATFILLVAIAAGAYYISGNKVIRPQSDNERISQWQAAIKAFEERPILGYGYLNFEHHSTEIKKRYGISNVDFGGHAHSNIFEMLASTGFLGLTAFILWVGFWFWEMYKRDDTIGNISMAFIAVFLAGGMTQSTISLGINLFFIMAGFAISKAVPVAKIKANL